MPHRVFVIPFMENSEDVDTEIEELEQQEAILRSRLQDSQSELQNTRKELSGLLDLLKETQIQQANGMYS